MVGQDGVYKVLFEANKSMTSTEIGQIAGINRAAVCRCIGRMRKWHNIGMITIPYAYSAPKRLYYLNEDKN